MLLETLSQFCSMKISNFFVSGRKCVFLSIEQWAHPVLQIDSNWFSKLDSLREVHLLAFFGSVSKKVFIECMKNELYEWSWNKNYQHVQSLSLCNIVNFNCTNHLLVCPWKCRWMRLTIGVKQIWYHIYNLYPTEFHARINCRHNIPVETQNGRSVFAFSSIILVFVSFSTETMR